jgi:hypothetical protein
VYERLWAADSLTDKRPSNFLRPNPEEAKRCDIPGMSIAIQPEAPAGTGGMLRFVIKNISAFVLHLTTSLLAAFLGLSSAR